MTFKYNLMLLLFTLSIICIDLASHPTSEARSVHNLSQNVTKTFQKRDRKSPFSLNASVIGELFELPKHDLELSINGTTLNTLADTKCDRTRGSMSADIKYGLRTHYEYYKQIITEFKRKNLENPRNYTPIITSNLPSGCYYIHTNSSSNFVDCKGEAIFSVPIFKEMSAIKTLSFTSTRIQVLDGKSIQNLPQIEQLIFLDGQIFRVAFKTLLKNQPNLQNLTISHNSISSISFSHFNNNPATDQLRVLDLRCNLITNLPSAPTDDITVLHNLEILLLSGNPMSVIPGDIFAPLRKSKLKSLFLKDSQITDFGKPMFGSSPSPLVYLPHLKELDLSNNPSLSETRLKDLLAPFNGKRLKILTLNHNNYASIPKKVLNIVKRSLEQLSLSGSSIFNIEDRSFPLMTSLTSLNLQHSRISQVSQSAFLKLPALKFLFLQGNAFTSFSNWLQLSNIQVLDMQSNPLYEETKQTSISNFNGISSVTILNLNKVPIKTIFKRTFSAQKNMKSLFLEQCHIEFIEDGSFENLNLLENLHLKGNKLFSMTFSVFDGLNNLNYLDLSNNEMTLGQSLAKIVEKERNAGGISHILNENLKENQSHEFEQFIDISGSKNINNYFLLPQLKVFLLNDNKIHFVPSNLFNNLFSLRYLDLSNNKIRNWFTPAFENLTDIEIINLSNNNIDNLTTAMIDDFGKRNLILDLRENIFHCNCILRAFKMDLQNVTFVKEEYYECAIEDKISYVNSYLSQMKHCVNTSISDDQEPYLPRLKLMGIFTGTFLLCLTLVLGTYRNRWYVKYLAYKLKIRYVVPETDRHKYDYDVFICYSHRDRQWVFETLIEHLESKNSLFRVCVHERDFLVGEDITRNIVRSVEVSRKVIVVISQAFVRSNWCMFELQMASNKIIDERKNKLILLLLEPIPMNVQPKELKILLRKRTYVSWPVDNEVRKLFWERLLRAIAKPTTKEEKEECSKNQEDIGSCSSSIESSRSQRNFRSKNSFSHLESFLWMKHHDSLVQETPQSSEIEYQRHFNSSEIINKIKSVSFKNVTNVIKSKLKNVA